LDGGHQLLELEAVADAVKDREALGATRVALVLHKARTRMGRRTLKNLAMRMVVPFVTGGRIGIFGLPVY